MSTSICSDGSSDESKLYLADGDESLQSDDDESSTSDTALDRFIPPDISRCSGSDHRYISSSDCILSQYMNGQIYDGKYYATGYLGAGRFVTPLHVLSLVPGHSTSRIAMHRSETTVKSCDVMVQSVLRRDLAVTGTDTVHVINAIEHVLKGMDENEFDPGTFETTVSVPFHSLLPMQVQGHGRGPPWALGTPLSSLRSNTNHTTCIDTDWICCLLLQSMPCKHSYHAT